MAPVKARKPGRNWKTSRQAVQPRLLQGEEIQFSVALSSKGISQMNQYLPERKAGTKRARFSKEEIIRVLMVARSPFRGSNYPNQLTAQDRKTVGRQ
jgi:hypothetical protein